MTTESKVTKSNARAQAYFSVFVTAIEGGINYWAAVNEYHWERAATITVDQDGKRVPKKVKHDDIFGFYAVIVDLEDDPEQEMRIDKALIARGVSKAYEKVKDGTMANKYHRQAIKDLLYGEWDDLDFDAETADYIVQCGLFGEAVYG